MKRKGLVLALAVAIDETLGLQHALSLPNAKRYITREIMRKHRIRNQTKVELADWLLALQVVLRDRVHYFERQSRNDKTPPEERMTTIIDLMRVVYTSESA